MAERAWVVDTRQILYERGNLEPLSSPEGCMTKRDRWVIDIFCELSQTFPEGASLWRVVALEHSGVDSHNGKGGGTSAKILEKQLLLPINLGRGYRGILRLFWVHHSTVRKIIQVENIQDSRQTFQEWTSRQAHAKVTLCNVQRNCKKPRRLYRPQLAREALKFMTVQLEEDWRSMACLEGL